MESNYSYNFLQVSERPAEFVDISSLLQILGFNSDQAFICSDNQQLFSLIHFSDVSAVKCHSCHHIYNIIIMMIIITLRRMYRMICVISLLHNGKISVRS